MPVASGSKARRGRQSICRDGTTPPGAALAERDGGGGGYDLNFENAPVATVAKVILGDVLKVGYAIDPRVQGTVTLASVRPVPKADALYVLENALKMSGVSLVRDRGGGYRLIPSAEAGPGSVDRGDGAEAGQGISVVPLRYVSALNMFKLLDGFAVKATTLRPDNGRNTLIVTGSGSEREAAIDTILSFDADWMKGQSVGVFPVRNSAPDPLISELDKIMDSAEGGMTQGMVKFQAISRLNSILVVSRKPEYLKRAALWISRLDRADMEAVNLKSYPLRYGNAKIVVTLLNDMLVGSSGGGAATGLESGISQIAPGSGLSASSSGTNPVAQLSGLPTAGAGASTPITGSPRLSHQRATRAGGVRRAARQLRHQIRQRQQLPAQRPHHRRCHQQCGAGLRQRGLATRRRADHPPDRPAAAPDRDRGDDCRGDAEQYPATMACSSSWRARRARWSTRSPRAPAHPAHRPASTRPATRSTPPPAPCSAACCPASIS